MRPRPRSPTRASRRWSPKPAPTSAPLAANGVDETVQAKQILNTVMDAALHGNAATYLYELVDSHPDATNASTEAHYGLFRQDWSAKPAAMALHNLTTILTTGTGDASGAAVDYTLSGLPATGASLLFHEANGAHDIVVWAEPDIWNEAAHAEIAAPNTAVTVNLGATYHAVAVYDPLQGATPVQVYADVNAVTLNVTDHPLVVELVGQGRGQLRIGGPGGDSLTGNPGDTVDGGRRRRPDRLDGRPRDHPRGRRQRRDPGFQRVRDRQRQQGRRHGRRRRGWRRLAAGRPR